MSLQLSKHFPVSLIFHLLFHLLDSQYILIIIPCSGETWQGQAQEIWVQDNLPGPKVMVHVTKQHSGHLEFSFGFFGRRTDADFRPGLTPSRGDGSGDGDAVTRGKSCVGQESHGHGWQGAGRRARVCRGNVGMPGEDGAAQCQLGNSSVQEQRVSSTHARCRGMSPGKRSSVRPSPAPCSTLGAAGRSRPHQLGGLPRGGDTGSALGAEGNPSHPAAQRGSGFGDKVSNTAQSARS